LAQLTDAEKSGLSGLPPDIEQSIKANAAALQIFYSLSPDKRQAVIEEISELNRRINAYSADLSG